jgi:hypothetical protein
VERGKRAKRNAHITASINQEKNRYILICVARRHSASGNTFAQSLQEQTAEISSSSPMDPAGKPVSPPYPACGYYGLLLISPQTSIHFTPNPRYKHLPVNPSSESPFRIPTSYLSTPTYDFSLQSYVCLISFLPSSFLRASLPFSATPGPPLPPRLHYLLILYIYITSSLTPFLTHSYSLLYAYLPINSVFHTLLKFLFYVLCLCSDVHIQFIFFQNRVFNLAVYIAFKICNLNIVVWMDAFEV